MKNFVGIVETTAGYFVGVLAIITFVEAVLRYGFQKHIPDGFVIGQMMQGIAICWGISTATYADRHIRVDILYEAVGEGLKRAFDVAAYTIHVLFAALFGAAMTFKVFDILRAGEISSELRIPVWMGYTLASIGIVVAFATALIRWIQVVLGHASTATEGPTANV
jgi:TRAP-type C4-dicarboxylate transport system permease small subunit